MYKMNVDETHVYNSGDRVYMWHGEGDMYFHTSIKDVKARCPVCDHWISSHLDTQKVSTTTGCEAECETSTRPRLSCQCSFFMEEIPFYDKFLKDD